MCALACVTLQQGSLGAVSGAIKWGQAVSIEKTKGMAVGERLS